MVDPATLTAVAKAAGVLLNNEKSRKAIGWIIVAILSPIIMIIVMIAAMFSGTAQHNANAVDFCFNGGPMPPSTPADYRRNIESMQSSFAGLDNMISKINAISEGGEIDSVRVKAIYFSLFFGSGGFWDSNVFANCFTHYEQREREIEIETIDDDGEPTVEVAIEIYMVSIPLTNLSEVYSNLEKIIGRTVTADEKNGAAEIYRHIVYGNTPTYGTEFDDWISGLPLSSVPFIGADGFCSPLGENWRSMVSSEFGYRKDPFTGAQKMHNGIDLGAPKGTPLHAALDGVVSLVRYSTTGYGYHVIIDHGGGFTTVYAHCSQILVFEGKEVSAGDVIALVGSTGRSTGPHLHFEVAVNGKKQNPRIYLP